ncbi:hypothetical protein Ancab_031538 [Ancistrocladus abbreviatus]
MVLVVNGKVAIITGGASGFGESTFSVFAQPSTKVIIADIQDGKGISLRDDINSHGGELTYIHCDVSNESDLKNVVEVVISKYGRLDVIFNNAGTPGDMNTNILDTNDEEFKGVINVNMYGAFLGAKHAARFMILAKSGVILFTSSITTLIGGMVGYAYTMSKHAVNGLMKNLCVELGQYGIRVNAISPGVIATSMMLSSMGLGKGTVDSVICESGVLKGTVPEAGDIAKAALYLASDDANETQVVEEIKMVMEEWEEARETEPGKGMEEEGFFWRKIEKIGKRIEICYYSNHDSI